MAIKMCKNLPLYPRRHHQPIANSEKSQYASSDGASVVAVETLTNTTHKDNGKVVSLVSFFFVVALVTQ
jgi:hypothetical protein